MSGDVTRYAGGSVAVSGAGFKPGEAWSGDAAFNGTSLTFHDVVPYISAHGPVAGFEIASSVDDTLPVRRAGGSYYQQRLAWRVTPEAVSIYDLRRGLAQRGDGKFTPVGDWRLEQTQTRRFVRPPSKREGDIPTQAGPARGYVPGGGGTDAAAEARFRQGALILGYLPGVVQVFCEKNVPHPDFFHGNLWQQYETRGGVQWPVRHSIELLRIGEGRAVVVTGVKSIGKRPLPPGTTVDAAQRLIASQPWHMIQTWGEVEGVRPSGPALGGSSQNRQLGAA